MKKKIKPLPAVLDEVEKAWQAYSSLIFDKNSTLKEELIKEIRDWCNGAGFHVNADGTLTIPEHEGDWNQTTIYLRALAFMMGEQKRFSKSL